MKGKNKEFRDQVLVVKVTFEEKKRIAEYAEKQCINVSALVRKLLFERLKDAY